MKNIEAETDDEVSKTILEKLIADDDGAAAIDHLAAGRPITYRDPRFPDEIIRKWPNGSCERVDVDATGAVTVLGPL